MLRLIAVALIFLVGGAAIGRYVLTLPPKKIIVREKVEVTKEVTGKASDTVFLKWKLSSTFNTALPQFGTLARAFVEKLQQASNGNFKIEISEPDKPIPPERCLDSLVEGKIQACWSTPGHWYSRERGLILFSGVPFGPDSQEYAAWFYYGGGKELLDELYGRHGVKSILCGVTAADGGGWFRKPLTKPEDLKGLKIRAYGLSARIYEAAGAKAVRLKGSDILASLKAGKLDGAEYSTPAIDARLGLHTVAKHYYLPGWHKPATFLEFLVSRKAWEALPTSAKALIQSVCGDTFRQGLAEGEATQPAALRELKAKGVSITPWPPEVLTLLKQGWQKVVREETAADPLFKKVWQSLTAFRSEYANWKDLGRLKPIPKPVPKLDPNAKKMPSQKAKP